MLMTFIKWNINYVDPNTFFSSSAHGKNKINTSFHTLSNCAYPFMKVKLIIVTLQICQKVINIFHVNVPFLYHLKTSGNPWFPGLLFYPRNKYTFKMTSPATNEE